MTTPAEYFRHHKDAHRKALEMMGHPEEDDTVKELERKIEEEEQRLNTAIGEADTSLQTVSQEALDSNDRELLHDTLISLADLAEEMQERLYAIGQDVAKRTE